MKKFSFVIEEEIFLTKNNERFKISIYKNKYKINIILLNISTNFLIFYINIYIFFYNGAWANIYLWKSERRKLGKIKELLIAQGNNRVGVHSRTGPECDVTEAAMGFFYRTHRQHNTNTYKP